MNERTRVGGSRLPTFLEPGLPQLRDADRDRLKRLLPPVRHRPAVKLAGLCSEANEKEAQELLEELKRQLGPSSRFDYAVWIDAKMPLAGHPWHDKIQTAIAACDFGLLLISPDFLTSEYITQ